MRENKYKTMKKILKIIGITIGAIIALLIIAIVLANTVLNKQINKLISKLDYKERIELIKASQYQADTVEYNFEYIQDQENAQKLQEYFRLDTLFRTYDTLGSSSQENMNTSLEANNSLGTLTHTDDNTWEKTKAIAMFVARNIPHANQTIAPEGRNAIALWEYTKNVEPAFNCRLHSILLYELLMAEGIINRVITCLPYDHLDNDCHVVNVVWIPEMDKWVMIDSDMFAYVTDENDTPLSLQEMRARIYEDKKINIVPIHDMKISDEYYHSYWAKNLYWFSSWDIHTYGRENPGHTGKYVSLVPIGYNLKELWSTNNTVGSKNQDIVTTDEDRFWAKPI